jgi:hypothetical protein
MKLLFGENFHSLRSSMLRVATQAGFAWVGIPAFSGTFARFVLSGRIHVSLAILSNPFGTRTGTHQRYLTVHRNSWETER